MSLSLLVLLALVAGPWSGQEVQAFGYLWSADNKNPSPFVPQEGDLMLTTSTGKMYAFLFALGRSGHPYHSGLVVRRSTGELEILEIGGSSAHWTTLRTIPERLTSLFQDFGDKGGAIWFRRRRCPLTPEQSARLTAFAESQVRKPFIKKVEVPFFSLNRGRPNSGDLDQKNWVCSEMLVTAMTHAGLIPAESIANPSKIWPRDMFYDQGIDMSAGWEKPLRWTGSANPPAPAPGGVVP
jgi:hypothetical protein